MFLSRMSLAECVARIRKERDQYEIPVEKHQERRPLRRLMHMKLTKSTKQRLPWEADSLSAIQELSHILRKPNIIYRVHNIQKKCPYTEPNISNPYIPFSLTQSLFPLGLPTKTYTHLSCHPHALHAPPSSFLLVYQIDIC